jgi:hypothetical protein
MMYALASSFFLAPMNHTPLFSVSTFALDLVYAHMTSVLTVSPLAMDPQPASWSVTDPDGLQTHSSAKTWTWISSGSGPARPSTFTLTDWPQKLLVLCPLSTHPGKQRRFLRSLDLLFLSYFVDQLLVPKISS